MFADTRDDKVMLDTVRMTAKDSVSVEVYADYSLITAKDTVPGRIAALWVQTPDGWRIFRQKRLSRTVKQETGGR